MRNHEESATANLELAYHGRVRTFQNLEDLAIGAAAGFNARDPNHDAVAMHGFTGGIGGDKDIARYALDRTIGDEETVAIAVHAQASGGELAVTTRGRIVAGAQLDEISSSDEPRQSGFEVLTALTLCAQLTHELFKIGFGMREECDMVQKRRIGHNQLLRLGFFRCNGREAKVVYGVSSYAESI